MIYGHVKRFSFFGNEQNQVCQFKLTFSLQQSNILSRQRAHQTIKRTFQSIVPLLEILIMGDDLLDLLLFSTCSKYQS